MILNMDVVVRNEMRKMLIRLAICIMDNFNGVYKSGAIISGILWVGFVAEAEATFIIPVCIVWQFN